MRDNVGNTIKKRSRALKTLARIGKESYGALKSASKAVLKLGESKHICGHVGTS